MTNKIIAATIGTILMGVPSAAKAAAGVSGGLSLLNDGDAAAASLGRAYTGINDRIAGMAYNPASLTTLQSGQASLLYQKGLIEDSYGSFMIGTPRGNDAGVGLSLGYYNGGKIDYLDENGNARSATAQQDITAGVGYARRIMGLSVGVNAKYLQSTLLETNTARAYAVDAGVQVPVSHRANIGFAALNYGTQLKYIEQGDNLPRMLRAGGSFLLFPGRNSTTLLLDASYMVNEKITTPAAGIETLIGPLALRMGFRSGGGTREFTAGAGFTVGRGSLDYAFGLVNQMDVAQHRVSLGMRFGGPVANTNFVQRPAHQRDIQEAKAQRVQPAPQANEAHHTLGGEQVLRSPIHQQQRRVYVVKEGDTLASIAQNELGDKRKWQAVYTANKHLIDDPSKIEKGMRIIIP